MKSGSGDVDRGDIFSNVELILTGNGGTVNSSDWASLSRWAGSWCLHSPCCSDCALQVIPSLVVIALSQNLR